jgi:hypothetical protein
MTYLISRRGISSGIPKRSGRLVDSNTRRRRRRRVNRNPDKKKKKKKQNKKEERNKHTNKERKNNTFHHTLAEPEVRHLCLLRVVDRLLEHAVLIAQTIAPCREVPGDEKTEDERERTAAWGKRERE